MIKNSFASITHSYDHPVIKKIQLFCTDGGDITAVSILFQNTETATFPIEFDAIYFDLFGIPVSEDGKLLFLASLEKGLTAVDTKTGEIVWRYKKKNIFQAIPYGHSLIVLHEGKALIKLDQHSGELLTELTSGTLECVFPLDNAHLLVHSFRGKYSILDMSTMQIIKTYSKKVVNPSNCLSLCIAKAYLTDNHLIIEGIEQYPNQNYIKNHSPATKFYRIIDFKFA